MSLCLAVWSTRMKPVTLQCSQEHCPSSRQPLLEVCSWLRLDVFSSVCWNPGDITMQYCSWHRAMNVILTVGKFLWQPGWVGGGLLLVLSLVTGCGSGSCDHTERDGRRSLPYYSINRLPSPAILTLCSHLSLSWLCLSPLQCVLIARSLAFQWSLVLEAQLSIAAL